MIPSCIQQRLFCPFLVIGDTHYKHIPELFCLRNTVADTICKQRETLIDIRIVPDKVGWNIKICHACARNEGFWKKKTNESETTPLGRGPCLSPDKRTTCVCTVAERMRYDGPRSYSVANDVICLARAKGVEKNVVEVNSETARAATANNSVKLQICIFGKISAKSTFF